MSELKVKGTITLFKDVQTGESKAGSSWSKQEFLIDTKTEYDNILCFEVFGEDKVANLTKYQQVGDEVEVTFNIKTNEWNGKHFTSLSAWRIEKVTSEQPVTTNAEVGSDKDLLPF